MRKILRFTFALLVFMPVAQYVYAQAQLAPDQNPDFMITRSKYMKVSDSVNTWHGTTFQETYKAIDYLEDKREARRAGKTFRRELRLERARNGWAYPYDQYSPLYYNSTFTPFNSYRRPYSYRYRYNNRFLWNTLPLAVALGLWWR